MIRSQDVRREDPFMPLCQFILVSQDGMSSYESEACDWSCRNLHMAITRHFLGWDRPVCETVPAHLLAESGPGMLDMRGTIVVVPTRQSSWRLSAALPLAADARSMALLGPDIVTAPVLLDSKRVATATDLQGLLAWCAVLTAVKAGELIAFLGAREGRTANAAWALQVARSLQGLRRELSDGGLTIAEVANRGAGIEEADRWIAMAELERRYIEQLGAWHLRDALSIKVEYARRGEMAPGVQRVVLAALPDPPGLLTIRLGQWAATGGTVEVLIAAPAAESAAFDNWGRPLPDAWQDRTIVLSDEDIWLGATPDAQANLIAEAVGGGMPAVPVATSLKPQLAIGVPDRETVAPLQRELAAKGLPAFDPQNRPFSETALFRLLQALLALRSRPGYSEVAVLLRHPDVLAMSTNGAGLLQELDEFQSRHLPVTLADMSAEKFPRAVYASEAITRIMRWKKTLCEPDFTGGVRAVLGEIFKNRMLNLDDRADAAFHQAAALLDTGLRELEGAAAAGQVSANAPEVLISLLQNASLKAERQEERLDLEGWLELAWNPAPLLFVAGMNEGFVPDGRVGDLFLPDSLRHDLGLRDDRLRVARDTYVLSALSAQRQKSGRVVLLVGKASTAGDPLRPSRLLFRCRDSELVARAQKLFKDPPPDHAAEAFTVGFKLDPAMISGDCINNRRSRELSPTTFRDYLQCPLRFYLRHVLDMQSVNDCAREPDALAFGNLVHSVLDEMAGDRKIWACGDHGEISQWMEQRLREHVRAIYGARPWLGVELAMDSAVQRLGAFAAAQVMWHAEGWEIIAREQTKECQINGVLVKGRIDRIDRNLLTGAVCVLDYKTTDNACTPAETHIGAPREDERLEAAVIPAELAGNRNDKRWTDLQLPLYREFVRGDHGPDVRLGYVCLPKALGETGFRLWESYSSALHTSAVKCAEGVVRQVKLGIFWPPGKIKSSYDDSFAGLLPADPARCIVPPVAPWRIGE